MPMETAPHGKMNLNIGALNWGLFHTSGCSLFLEPLQISTNP